MKIIWYFTKEIANDMFWPVLGAMALAALAIWLTKVDE